MTIKLLIHFQPGAYSKNKEVIKKVFNRLDYKYQSGFQQNDKLICIWIRKPETQKIKAIFNGSGKECQFIIECNEDEQQAFQSFSQVFNARVSIYNENIIDTNAIEEKAKQEVNKWFTWQKPYQNEPELFYIKRQEKMKESYNFFVNSQIEKIKKGLLI